MSAGTAGAGAGAVVRQGHLRKLKTMKKKYFVLRAETADCSARLEYYESEKKFRAGAAPRRVLPLKGCYNITRRLDLKQKHVIALFTREEQFCIVAENEQELHAWLTAIVKQHRSDDASEELLHPTQHVWQVNVQKKGLGSSKNIQGLYNLCLTDKTLSLVKIKSQNNVISDLGIPEKIEYSLKNIRRCGDSECFFYMEVGRQTSTGAGELWMHSDDSNIAQSMHSTIYLAMRNCAKETENERDHIILPGDGSAALPPRRQTYSDARGRAGLTNDAGPLRSRCDSMPSRACSSFEVDRPAPRHIDLEDCELHSKWKMDNSDYKCERSNLSRRHRKYMSSHSILMLLPFTQRQESPRHCYHNWIKDDSSPNDEKRSAESPEATAHVEQPKEQIDEDDIFAFMVAQMMKKLKVEQKHYAKVEILNVMNRAAGYSPEHCGAHTCVTHTLPVYSDTYDRLGRVTVAPSTTGIDIKHTATTRAAVNRRDLVTYATVFPSSLHSNSSFDSQNCGAESDFFDMSPKK